MDSLPRWITQGFDCFRAGIFGNGGQNLYVSRDGILQRIFQYDLNKDGYFDLVLCNSQHHDERPPTYIYTDIFSDLQRIEVPSDSAMTGAVADLNGNGCDDLILGMHDNGIRQDLNAIIYYGGVDGWSERRVQYLPGPLCTAMAVGDFDGNGRPDMAAICDGKLRLFKQTDLGFVRGEYTDLDIYGQQLAAGDLDGDGCAELVVRQADGSLKVYWGDASGLDAARVSTVSVERNTFISSNEQAQYAEYVAIAPPLPGIIHLHGTPHLFASTSDAALLVPVHGRFFGEPEVITCNTSMAVAVGDIDGDGHDDLVIACYGDEGSRVYWGGEDGFSETRMTLLPTRCACDVAVGDLDGDQCAEIVICQGGNFKTFDVKSSVFRGVRPGHVPPPVMLEGHDSRRVFIARPAGGPPTVVLVNHFSGGVLGNADVSIFWGGPDGFDPLRQRQLPAWGAVECLYCDINDDGWPDLVIANASENSVSCDPGSYVYLNSPDGFTAQPSITLPTQRAHGVCCADLNRDGYLDLVFCGFDTPEITIFWGSANGFDLEHPTRVRLERDGITYSEARWIYLVDLNGDGWLDLVVPQITFPYSLILWGGAEGFSVDRSQLLAVERAACARAADLTGNGFPDLIIAGHTPSAQGPHDTYAAIYWNGPEGIREDNKCLLPVSGANAMAVADFNHDGLLDLFVCSYHNGRERDIDSYLYWNRPVRGFSARDRSRLFTHSASGALAVDFNNDGWVDLAIANHKVEGNHLGYSTIWWNGPDGFDDKRQTFLPSSGPHGITAVEPGNILDRGPEEYYLSVPHEMGDRATVASFIWEAELPSGTWLRARLRCASTHMALEYAPWSAWCSQGQEIPVPVSGWAQFELALGAYNSLTSPRVRGVEVQFR